ncbi:hypothetical protein [PinkBerry-associated phage LS06-2018-MD08]|nr:hypothetical protein [PinkBerry-associated phage LS06-2018-MD08]
MSEIKLLSHIFSNVQASKVYIPKRLHDKWRYEKGDYVIEDNKVWELTDMKEEIIVDDCGEFEIHNYEFTNTGIIKEME